MSSNNKCAIYARYSNIDKKTDGDECQSINNQIRILSEYAIEQGFTIYDKYFDYHISGTIFDREGLNRLLADAKAKKFNIIIVKDLSRFGRNYIEVGTYLNKIFPDLGIRFIAVNDNLDTDKPYDVMEIGLKNLLNHLYVKDIGRKIRRTFSMKLKTEMMRSRHYGYVIKNKKATIYEPEAKIVRRIFNEANNGKSIFDIYTDLNKDEIPNPGSSYYLKTNNKEKYSLTKEKKWNTTKVKDVLTDEFYTGVTINCAREVKSTNERNIRIENTHPVIISKDLFNEVNNKLFGSENYSIWKGRLKHMIYCKKCLARNNLNKGKASISLKEIDNKLYYIDYECKVRYPFDLFNKRLYEQLLSRYNYISNHKNEYINKALIELTSIDGKALEYFNLKDKYQNDFSNLFETYINGEISEAVYKEKADDLKNKISKCETYINNLQISDVTNNFVITKVNKFLNSFYESENPLDTIKEFVDVALYDPRNGKLEIILKFETELGLPSAKLENIIVPEIIKSKDFDLNKIILDILKEHPYLKIKGILNEAQKIWDGFTYESIKKRIFRLKNKGLVKTEPTKNKNADGYMLAETSPDDFDYKGMTLSRIEKECYKYIYNNPKVSYDDIANHFNVSNSQAREYVLALRNQKAFDDPHFDKTYIPRGSLYSIYTGHQKLSSDIEDKVIEYIKNNPLVSRYKLKNTFNITEGQARKLLERVKKEVVCNE